MARNRFMCVHISIYVRTTASTHYEPFYFADISDVKYDKVMSLFNYFVENWICMDQKPLLISNNVTSIMVEQIT